jgi:hypothetical protein
VQFLGTRQRACREASFLPRTANTRCLHPESRGSAAHLLQLFSSVAALGPGSFGQGLGSYTAWPSSSVPTLSRIPDLEVYAFLTVTDKEQPLWGACCSICHFLVMYCSAAFLPLGLALGLRYSRLLLLALLLIVSGNDLRFSPVAVPLHQRNYWLHFLRWLKLVQHHVEKSLAMVRQTTLNAIEVVTA